MLSATIDLNINNHKDNHLLFFFPPYPNCFSKLTLFLFIFFSLNKTVT